MEEATIVRIKKRGPAAVGSFLEEPHFDEEAYHKTRRYGPAVHTSVQQYSMPRCEGRGHTIIPKMRQLLSPAAQSKIGFRETPKDASNILFEWLNDDIAGTRIFIPHL